MQFADSTTKSMVSTKLLCVVLITVVFPITSRAEFLYTQNVTDNNDGITVFPSVVVQLTCVTNQTAILWNLPDGGNTFVNPTDNNRTLGDFTILASMEGSLFVSTATITAMSNVSLECNDFVNSSIITISIKPIVPQLLLKQNITDDDSNITICPGIPVSITCQSTTGVVVWSLNDGPIRQLTSIEQSDILGNFSLLVTNVTQLLLLVESTAIASIYSDVIIMCSTGTNASPALSSALSLNIRSRPSSVLSVNIVQVCHDYITLNWTALAPLGSPELDYYQLTVSPTGTCTSSESCSVYDIMETVSGLQDKTLYTFGVSGVNCNDRTGPGVQVTQTITRREPSIPRLVELNLIAEESNATTATIFVKWEPAISTDCLQPPVTEFIILVTGVRRSVITVDDSLTNITTSVPACGVSAVTVSAINNAGNSDRSDPLVFTGSVLTLSTATLGVESDTVSLAVTITECLRPAVDNITITYRQVRDFGFTRSISYPNDSMSAIFRLTDLLASTVYNATVIVYYRDNGKINVLGPQSISFSTSQSFFSFQEAVIAGLATGFGISLIVITILIVLMVVFCYILRLQHKRGKTLGTKLRRLTIRQKEIQLEVQDYKENVQTIRAVGQSNVDLQRGVKEEREMATLTNVKSSSDAQYV